MTYWDISTASYDNKYKDISSEGTNLYGLSFSSDGTKMYVAPSSNDDVFQYSLSTAWDVSTASYDSKSYDLSGETSLPVAIFFSSDGTKLFVLDNSNDRVHQHVLTTAWDISTTQASLVNKYIGSEDTVPRGLFFKPDGYKMYMSGNTNNKIYQYSVVTPWQISSLSYDSKSFDVSSEIGSVRGVFFKSDGTKMYVGDSTADAIFQYSLSTAWDVSTASYDNVSCDVGSESTLPHGLFFDSDGSKMFIGGYYEYTVFQYSMPGAKINPKVKEAGSFSTKAVSVKESGSFSEKDLKVKVDGTFQ